MELTHGYKVCEIKLYIEYAYDHKAYEIKLYIE